MTRSRLLPALLALALAAPAAHAQALASRAVPVGYPAGHADGGVHILTALPDGSVGCDAASEAEARAFRAADEAAGTVRLTPLPSLNRGGTGFRILIRATPQLLAQPAALLAFRRAAARWEQIITSNVTTVMDLDYGPTRFGPTSWPANVLGSTTSATVDVNAAGPGDVRAAIAARLTDPALIALVNAIPVPTPSTVDGEAGAVPLNRLFAGLVTRQVLGYSNAVTSPAAAFGSVPNIGFNSAFAYDFNPRDGITSSQTDFEALAAHEIGHALGFTSAIGPNSTTANARFSQWDLYRVRPDEVVPGESYTDGAGWEVTRRLLQPGPTIAAGLPGNHVMFVGDAEYELSTARGDRTGGDTQQASHWRADEYRPAGPGRYIGIMDPTLAAGEREDITAADVRALELFGYAVDRTPSTATAQLAFGGRAVNIDFLSTVARAGLPVGGGSVTVAFTNTGGPDALTYDAAVVVDSVQTLGGTPTVTLSAASGTVAAGTTSGPSLDVTGVTGGAVVYGRLAARLSDVNRGYIDVPFQVSVGTPALTVGTSVTVPSGQVAPVTLALTSSGDAPLTYVRVLEPATSDPGTARHALEGDAVTAGGPAAEPAELPDGATAAPALASLTITGSALMKLYDLAVLPTGEVAVADGGDTALTRILVAPADLSAVTATYTSSASLGGRVTGLAFNTNTNSLWVAVQETGLLREVALSGTDIVPTGRDVATGTTPFGLDYSPELDAFFLGALSSNAVYAVDASGRTLPGYPAAVEGRAGNPTGTPGLSFTEGLLEMTSSSSRSVQAGMFGKTVAGAVPQVFPVTVYGIERSPTDRNGTLYFTSRTTGTTATVQTLDPADVPAGVGTRILARGPLFSTALLAPGQTRTLALLADARNLPQGSVTDELAFLTNSGSARVLRSPVTINVGAVAGEAGPGAAIGGVTLSPNPAVGAARVRLTLAAPADVSVAVYNTLGQRVAVLAEGAALAPGTTDLALDTSRLAAGVYVVRVTAGSGAGASVTTQKLTVVR